MNLKIKLLKLLPLITFITLLVPTSKIVRAASSAPEKLVNPTQEILTKETHSVQYAAAPKADIPAKSTKKIVLSEKAAQIEFVIFGSLIGLGILIPEILFKSKKKKKSGNSEAHRDGGTNNKPEKTVEPDLEFLKVISEKSGKYNGKVENQANSKSA